MDRGHLSIKEGIWKPMFQREEKHIRFNLGVHWAGLEKSKYFGERWKGLGILRVGGSLRGWSQRIRVSGVMSWVKKRNLGMALTKRNGKTWWWKWETWFSGIGQYHHYHSKTGSSKASVALRHKVKTLPFVPALSRLQLAKHGNKAKKWQTWKKCYTIWK